MTKSWHLILQLFLFASLILANSGLSQDSLIRQRVEKIDEQITKVLDANKLSPSDVATDGEWCRRVYLDLLGRIPTVEELDQFVSEKPEKSSEKSFEKKAALVEKLLYSESYTEEFARNWTTIWSNLLIGRTGGNANNSMISRDGMQKYLRDSFAREKPYNQFVSELIAGSGNTRPGSEKFNGATNFLIDKVNAENGAQATAATSQIFLGLQVQCTQCHNHPFNDWKQQKYWEMNAFFRQTRAFQGRTDADSPTLADQDFQGESGNIDEADLFYELRNGLLKVAYPVFVDGTEIPHSGYVNVVNRREKLAKFVVESPYFSKAIVNRLWAHFLGYGFTKPIDDLGPHNIPSHPDLLAFLSQEFVSVDYDLRQLMTWIVLSKPYSLSSICTKANELDDPMLGSSPKFSHFYLRQMSAEQLYESMIVATGSASEQLSYEEQELRRNRWLQQFASTFGTDEGDESTTFNGTIPQVLMMFNGEMINAATAATSGTLIEKAMKFKGTEAVEFLFKAGLARGPDREETKIAQLLLEARAGDSREALKDLWWIILNSNEFIFVH